MPENEPAGRLDSWKQIAAYLDKSERTVRRWQQTEGLPVHKHQHQAKGSVWAYQEEIDAWLAARRVSPEPLLEEDSPVAPPPEPAARAWWPWALLALIPLVAIGGWLFGRRGQAPAVLEGTPFTSLPGSEFGASPSPDGRQVAFFWGAPSSEKIGIYVKSREAEQPVPIDTGNGFAYSPAWSPDGKTIAFLRRTPEGTWLCLVGASGGPARNLVKLSERQAFFGSSRHLSWGPGSDWLLAPMLHPSGEQGIYRISLDGGQRRLTPNHSAHSAMLAPDGRSFAYVRDGGSPLGRYAIVVQREGGDAVTVFEGQGMPAGLDWAPGGKELIACLPALDPAQVGSDGPYESRLYRVPLEGGATPTLLGLLKPCSTVTVASSRLLFGAASEPKSNLWRASLEGLDQPLPVAPSSRADEYPSLSPDGAAVAFISSRSGRREIWVARPDGDSPRRVTENAAAEGNPVWSPDGSRLLFGSAALKPKGLMIVPIAGGSAQAVPLGGQEAQFPVWSRDGRHIYYSSGPELWRCAADGSQRVRLRNDGYQHAVVESPDGRSLYVVKLGKKVELADLPLDGAGPGKIVATISDRWPDRHIGVSPGALWFANAEGLWRIPFGGAPVLRRKGFLGARPAAVLVGLTVSPDEKWLLWGRAGLPALDIEEVVGFQ